MRRLSDQQVIEPLKKTALEVKTSAVNSDWAMNQTVGYRVTVRLTSICLEIGGLTAAMHHILNVLCFGERLSSDLRLVRVNGR